ncbi:hypothetical protein NP233_g4377 [Leucocoprinus birnbaumii]|uniref:Uncharacterized protein n=1 Tax=Leucocoprinus birnbaumii TaxID=56174 RepID=A0AAD5VV52_9AGAR|nr:hypothetical protein NP233_g4377 [Leucocoprinus birnbaumii]
MIPALVDIRGSDGALRPQFYPAFIRRILSEELRRRPSTCSEHMKGVEISPGFLGDSIKTLSASTISALWLIPTARGPEYVILWDGETGRLSGELTLLPKTSKLGEQPALKKPASPTLSTISASTVAPAKPSPADIIDRSGFETVTKSTTTVNRQSEVS